MWDAQPEVNDFKENTDGILTLRPNIKKVTTNYHHVQEQRND